MFASMTDMRVGSSGDGATITAEVLAELLDAVPADLAEGALVEHLLTLDKADACLAAARCAAAGALDAKKTWAADGARTAASWMAARLDLSIASAKHEVHLARDLRQMPVVDDAAQAGRLGRAKVILLAKARTPELVEVFAAQEAYLVAEVEGLRVDDTRRFLARWQQIARLHIGWTDPDEPGRADAPAASVNLSPTFEGRFVLDGELDAENGSIVRNIISAEVDEMFRLGVFSATDGLDPAERRGQALVQILMRKGHTGTKNGEIRPSVEVIVDEEVLRGVPLDADDPEAAADDMARRVCEFVDGGAVTPAALARFLCGATVHRLVLNARGEVLDAGHDIRLANRAQRRALRYRHQGCAFPGCSAPASWCEAHHVIPFDPINGEGPTDLANMVLLCRFHHHRVHDDGYLLTLNPDGSVEVLRPDRAPITPARARPPSPAPPAEPDEMVILARERARALRPAA